MIYNYDNIYQIYNNLLNLIYYVGHGIMEFAQLFSILELQYPNQLTRQIDKLHQYGLVDIFNINKFRFIKLKAKGVSLVTDNKTSFSIRITEKLIQTSLINAAIFQHIISSSNIKEKNLNMIIDRLKEYSSYIKDVDSDKVAYKQFAQAAKQNIPFSNKNRNQILKSNDKFKLSGITYHSKSEYICLSLPIVKGAINAKYIRDKIKEHILLIQTLFNKLYPSIDSCNVKFVLRFYIADALYDSLKPTLANMVTDIKIINGSSVIYLCKEVHLKQYMQFFK